jgi:hypothetical protein
VADCYSKGVSSIFLGDFREVKESFNHVLHLLLGGMSVTDHGTLDLQSRILVDFQVEVYVPLDSLP